MGINNPEFDPTRLDAAISELLAQEDVLNTPIPDMHDSFNAVLAACLTSELDVQWLKDAYKRSGNNVDTLFIAVMGKDPRIVGEALSDNRIAVYHAIGGISLEYSEPGVQAGKQEVQLEILGDDDLSGSDKRKLLQVIDELLLGDGLDLTDPTIELTILERAKAEADYEKIQLARQTVRKLFIEPRMADILRVKGVPLTDDIESLWYCVAHVVACHVIPNKNGNDQLIRIATARAYEYLEKMGLPSSIADEAIAECLESMHDTGENDDDTK